MTSFLSKKYIKRNTKINLNKEKLIRGGEIDKNGWYKINKLFNQKRKTEFYQKDHQFKEIIDFYKDLYEHNKKEMYLIATSSNKR